MRSTRTLELPVERRACERHRRPRVMEAVVEGEAALGRVAVVDDSVEVRAGINGAGAARGAASFLTETISRVRHAGASGQLTVRADSAFYSKAMIATASKFDVRFSITASEAMVRSWNFFSFSARKTLASFPS